MKNKYRHKGAKDFNIVNNYQVCFGPGSKAASFKQDPTIKDAEINALIEITCSQCKNFKCERAGFLYGYRERNQAQVEILLNDPLFSDLSTEEEKRISSLNIENLKQKIEQLVLNTSFENADWENADRSKAKSYPEIDSKESVSFPKIPKIDKPPTEVSNRSPETSPSTLKKTKPQPMRNTPVQPGGFLIGEGPAPSTTIVRPIDPWTDADKMVKSGATITVKSDPKKN
jgi:hypothetical protein